MARTKCRSSRHRRGIGELLSSAALVIPLGLRDMGWAVAGPVGRVTGLLLGLVVGLPALAVWLGSLAVIRLGNLGGRLA